MSCIQPYYAQYKGNLTPFPCGRCPPCRKRRTDGWVFRMMQEERRHFHSHFVTLTYDPEHVPISPNGYMTLTRGRVKVGGRWKDLCCFTKFMKRLRKLVPKGTILKYYYCGEYGTVNKRPHWHAIIFGCPDDRLYAKAWSLDGVQFGRVDVGTVTGDSIAYTTAYACSSDFQKWHARDDRVPEFSGMSKGLGRNYVTEQIKRYHREDLNRNYCVKDGGSRVALPRYYRNLIYDEDDREAQRSIIEREVARSNSEEYDRFKLLYPGGDWEQFKVSQRDSLIRSFENRKNSRKL